jgi:hypothetical protein
MLLKWTIRAFALAAALPLGIAAAQNTDSPAVPAPAAADASAQNDTPAAQDDQTPDAANGPQDAIPQDARFAAGNAPAGDQPQVADHVRAATQHLNIDDETRSRYRWHNGEWWFKTKSGQWKIYREGKWIDFDPTTYTLPAGARQDFSPQSGGPAPDQTYGASDGYYYQGRPNGGAYRAFRPTYGAYNGGFNNGYYGNGFNNGYYGNGAYGAGYGTGIQGYNPSNDRYYGYGAYGQPYSVNGGQYRGAVIGSQIGGQLGGNTGALLGGAIGARAGKK